MFRISELSLASVGRKVTDAALEGVTDSLGNTRIPRADGAECGAASARSDSLDADLQSLVDAWPRLSIEARGAVLRLVMTSKMTPEMD